MTMPKILLVGQDFRLLATRAAVLAKTHANVVCCSAIEALKILDGERFDLVVLCHSLTESEVARVTETVHRRWAATRILLVVSNVAQERLYKGVDFDATSLPDPDRLIGRTAELLQDLPNHRIEESMRVERHQATPVSLGR
jgi:CheY-like chemotaxis protein